MSFFSLSGNQFINVYDSLDDKTLMSFFSSEKWPSDINERQQLLQSVSDRISDRNGVVRTPVTLRYENSTNMGGYINPNKGIILNDKYNNNPFEALDTIAHETNHHIQSFARDNYEKGNYSDEERSILKAEFDSGYGIPKENDDYYNLQGLEIDSNKFGFDYVTANHENFKNDQAYKDYLQSRNDYFNNNCNYYDNNKNEIDLLEKEHFKKAHDYGDIDNRELYQANEAVDYGHSFKNKLYEARDKSNELLNDINNNEENAILNPYVPKETLNGYTEHSSFNNLFTDLESKEDPGKADINEENNATSLTSNQDKVDYLDTDNYNSDIDNEDVVQLNNFENSNQQDNNQHIFPSENDNADLEQLDNSKTYQEQKGELKENSGEDKTNINPYESEKALNNHNEQNSFDDSLCDLEIENNPTTTNINDVDEGLSQLNNFENSNQQDNNQHIFPNENDNADLEQLDNSKTYKEQKSNNLDDNHKDIDELNNNEGNLEPSNRNLNDRESLKTSEITNELSV